jgi:hypothetical protein
MSAQPPAYVKKVWQMLTCMQAAQHALLLLLLLVANACRAA